MAKGVYLAFVALRSVPMRSLAFRGVFWRSLAVGALLKLNNSTD